MTLDFFSSPGFWNNLNKISDCISRKDYQQCVNLAVYLNSQSDICSLLHAVVSRYGRIVDEPPILPSRECKIIASSDINHPVLRGDLHTLNNRSQFIFHTINHNPWVIIDFGRNLSSKYPVYLYNRCQSGEISKRIEGCRFLISTNRNRWREIPIMLTKNQVYAHEGIEICSEHEFRYIKLDRIDSSTPIHLSQITLGRPLDRTHASLKICNLLFAAKHGLRLADDAKIVENEELNYFMEFCACSNDSYLSLKINQVGRFSNFLIQLANAILLARTWNISNIYLPEMPRVRDLFPDSRLVACKNSGILIRIGEAPLGLCLEGSFLYRREMPVVFKNAPPLIDLVNEFKSSCGFNAFDREHSMRKLTIHIRSGDIFGNGYVHPGYGQPPLAFYLQAISHFKPNLVLLVYENDLNPVIPCLIEYLRSNSIRYHCHSSTNLRDDIMILINARALVIGNGTFARGVVCFADLLERIYTFHVPFPGNVLGAKQGKLRNIVIKDSSHGYVDKVLKDNWLNSCEQRSLMISYDESNLVLVE